MNTKLKIRNLPVLTAGMGFSALILRFALYALAVDEKGLLTANHPLELLLWLLTGIAAAGIVWQAWLSRGSRKYSLNFPASITAAVGCGIFAAGVLVTVLLNRNALYADQFVRNIAGLLVVPAMAALAICRQRGKRPHFLFHAVVCVFLVLYIISHYPDWSSCPQLQDSFFPLMGFVCLLLFAYHQTAFDVGMGSRRTLLGFGLLAVYGCLAAVPNNPDGLLYAAGAVWAVTNLCRPNAASRVETDSRQ